MAEIVQFQNIPETDGSAWAGIGLWGGELRSPELTDYMVERTPAGLFSVAVRGYNGGTPTTLNFEEGGDLRVFVDNEYYALNHVNYERVATIAPDITLAYRTAMELPEKGVDEEPLSGHCPLARVIEDELPGVWNFSHDDEGHALGRLIYIDPDRIGVQFYNTSRWDPANESFESPDPKLYPVNVRRDGPVVNLLPYGGRGMPISFDSISDRITHLDNAIRQPGSNDEAFASLNWAIDAFEMGQTG